MYNFSKHKNHQSWGPYSPLYIGASLITDQRNGHLMDFPVSLGVSNPYKRTFNWLPRKQFDDYNCWESNETGNFWSYRYYLRGLEKLGGFAEFAPLDQNHLLGKINFYNHSQKNVNYFADILGATLLYEPVYQLNLQKNELWIEAHDYDNIDAYVERYELTNKRQCQTNWYASQLTGLGCHFGLFEGDRVNYSFHLPRALSEAYIYIRMTPHPVNLFLQIDDSEYPFHGMEAKVPDSEGLDTFSHVKKISGKSPFGYRKFLIGNLAKGKHILQILSRQDQCSPVHGPLFDGILITPNPRDFNSRPLLSLKRKIASQPEVMKNNGGLIIRNNRNNDHPFFMLSSSWSDKQHRIINHDDFDYALDCLDKKNLTSKHFVENGLNKWANLHLQNISCPPGKEKAIYFVISSGKSQFEVKNECKMLLRNAEKIMNEKYLEHSRSKYKVSHSKFRFSQEHPMNTLLMSVNFPGKLSGRYLPYFTPGKSWCGKFQMWTWDHGLIALTLSEYSKKLALKCIDEIFPLRKAEIPVVFFGTSLATQIYALWEVYNHYSDVSVLKKYYHKLKQVYDFFSGRHAKGPYQQGDLLDPKQVYPQCGADDNPPHNYRYYSINAWKNGCQTWQTAHLIRLAKIMRLMACIIKNNEDIKTFSRDIAKWSKAMLKYQWDDTSGYFSYLIGKTKMRWGNTKYNYNMTLEGAIPLIADFTNPAQNNKILKNLMTAGRLWTKFGLTQVDQRAPYYNPDGYHNGSVWMMNQWFFWKTLINLGELASAEKIARTAIALWQKEHDRNHKCYEYFKNGKGMGAEGTTSINSQVISFFNAYYSPRRVTTGFDTIIEMRQYDPQKDEIKLKLSSPFRKGTTGIITVMTPNIEYEISVGGGKYQKTTADANGAVSFILKLDDISQSVLIKPMEKH